MNPTRIAMTAGATFAVLAAVACGTSGSSGPTATPEAKAAAPAWCSGGYACIIKIEDGEEITPQMLDQTVNSMYCSNRGVSTVALKWKRDPNAGGDQYKVTRLAVVCPD